MTELSLHPALARQLIEMGWTPPPNPGISDDELLAQTTRRNRELGNPAAVRALIQTFKPEDVAGMFRLKDIRQQDRREYLRRLAALTLGAATPEATG